MEGRLVRGRLETLKAQIEAVGHGASIGGWVGDRANDRSVHHDLQSGRTHWESAWRHANNGLVALDDGNLNLGLSYLLAAHELAFGALLKRLDKAARKGEGLDSLAKPAGKPGAPRKRKVQPAGPRRPRGRPPKS